MIEILLKKVNNCKGKGILFKMYYNNTFIGEYTQSNKDFGNSYIIYNVIENNVLYGYRRKRNSNIQKEVKYNLPKNTILPIEKQEFKFIFN